MEKQKVETVLNQMKRSTHSQTVISGTALGQQVIPWSDKRVSLVIGSVAGSAITVGLTADAAGGSGMTIPAGGAPLALSLAQNGTLIYGPFFLNAGTTPANITYWESLNHAP